MAAQTVALPACGPPALPAAGTSAQLTRRAKMASLPVVSVGASAATTTLPASGGAPTTTLPASGGAPALPAFADQAAFPIARCRGQAEGHRLTQETPALPTSGLSAPMTRSPASAFADKAVLPTVRCLGRAEGKTKRQYEALVSLEGIPPGGPKRRRLKQKTLPCLRENATDDLHILADMFGGDLLNATMPASGGSVPSSWLEYSSCAAVLREHGISPSRVDVLEVYAGCANWTSACRVAGLSVGPAIDNKHQQSRWDLLSAKWRRVLWAIAVVCQPRWIHSGFPCTFWVRLAHLTRKKTREQNEADRLRALVHVVVTTQLANWQHRHNLIMSFENPPGAASWNLDIVQRTLAEAKMQRVYFDSCAWGHCDVESGKPYLKRQCIAASASVDLSPLARKCTCPGGRARGVHQVVEGTVRVPGEQKAVSRSTKSGEYPTALCRAWAQLVKERLR